jgi:hypothetical protein
MNITPNGFKRFSCGNNRSKQGHKSALIIFVDLKLVV